MNVIALYSIKGGVGKTAAAVNLAYLAAREGKPVLLCDLDPQASASFYFRIKPKVSSGSKLLLKSGKKVMANIKETDFEGLDLLPADFSFRNLDLLFDDAKQSQKCLKTFLKPLQEHYATVFLDCPPNLTLLSENVFRAAHMVLTPVIPTTLSLRTLHQLYAFFEEHRLPASKIRPFVSMFEPRKSMHKQCLTHLIETFPAILKTPIPYLSDVEKMGIHRQPVPHFADRSRATQAYMNMWQELRHLLNPNQ